MRWEPAAWFIPAGRFPGLIAIAIAGIRLSQRSTTTMSHTPRPPRQVPTDP
jgi:hypothetical protein